MTTNRDLSLHAGMDQRGREGGIITLLLFVFQSWKVFTASLRLWWGWGQRSVSVVPDIRGATWLQTGQASWSFRPVTMESGEKIFLSFTIFLYQYCRGSIGPTFLGKRWSLFIIFISRSYLHINFTLGRSTGKTKLNNIFFYHCWSYYPRTPDLVILSRA